MIGRTTIASSRTTGFLTVLDTARIADSPGLMIAVKFSTSSMPMLEIEKVDPLISSGARPPARAKSGKLKPEEFQGGGFSISNMGMLDVENFTAIINPGESAILAVSSTVNKPVVRGEAIVVRPIMKMTLSSDHRLIDGATAARFVNSIKTKLEDYGLWSALTS